MARRIAILSLSLLFFSAQSAAAMTYEEILSALEDAYGYRNEARTPPPVTITTPLALYPTALSYPVLSSSSTACKNRTTTVTIPYPTPSTSHTCHNVTITSTIYPTSTPSASKNCTTTTTVTIPWPGTGAGTGYPIPSGTGAGTGYAQPPYGNRTTATYHTPTNPPAPETPAPSQPVETTSAVEYGGGDTPTPTSEAGTSPSDSGNVPPAPPASSTGPAEPLFTSGAVRYGSGISLAVAVGAMVSWL